jgi:hypothetical protein
MPNKSVSCLAGKRSQAEQIIRHLTAAGFFPEDISLLFSESHGDPLVDSPADDSLDAHVGNCGLKLPEFGPFVAAGPILAGLCSTRASGISDSIAVTLIAMGFPEIEAHRYEEKITAGDILIAIHAEDRGDANDIEEIFRQSGAHDMCLTSMWAPKIFSAPLTALFHPATHELSSQAA